MRQTEAVQIATTSGSYPRKINTSCITSRFTSKAKADQRLRPIISETWILTLENHFRFSPSLCVEGAGECERCSCAGRLTCEWFAEPFCMTGVTLGDAEGLDPDDGP